MREINVEEVVLKQMLIIWGVAFIVVLLTPYLSVMPYLLSFL